MTHDGDRDSAYSSLKNYIGSHGCPDAIFCMNDEIVIAANAALFDMGIRVPQEVALVGCDDIDETQYHRPKLSSIAFPFSDVARICWEYLFARIESHSIERQSCVLQAPFMARESSFGSA
jgi:LacI family transcriptional regulator